MRTQLTRITCASMACLLLAGAARVSAYTVKHFTWTKASSECDEDDPDSLPTADNESAAWYNKMIDNGYRSAGYLVNGLNTDRFCDPDYASDPSDCSDASNGVDEATAILLHLHGIDVGRWEGLLNDRGSADDTCYANVHSDFHVGDGKAAFVHLFSCESLDDHALIDAPDMMYDATESEDSGNYLHLLTGFHGAAWSGEKAELKRLAKNGYDSSVADAWMDQLYASVKCGWDGHCFEQCPVALASGATVTETDSHLDDDSYSDPNADPTGSGAFSYLAFEDCDPKAEPPFDPDDEYDSSDW